MNIAIIGTGFVGVVSSAVFASHGHHVWGIDIDSSKIAKLNQGIAPFFEPGLEELLQEGIRSELLTFTTDYAAAIPSAEVVMITVGTPSSPEGKADLSYVLSACESLGPHLRPGAVVVIKSTVPPGSFQQVAAVLSNTTKVSYHLASVPEFLREGSAVADTVSPDRIVLGVTDEISENVLTKLHKPFQAPLVVTKPESAQLGKYAANAYLALRIGFINQIADFCEASGADVNDVIKIIGHDRRIGSHYWYPGLGYGGSCFPKDVRELAYSSKVLSLGETLFTSLNSINSARIAKKLAAWGKSVNGFSHKRVAVLGLSFKPSTTDLRESPALTVIPYLLDQGATVVGFDPMAVEEAEKLLPAHEKLQLTSNLATAIEDADILLALIEWPQIITHNYQAKKGRPQWFIDARNQFNPQQLRQAGFTYIGIGSPISGGLS